MHFMSVMTNERCKSRERETNIRSTHILVGDEARRKLHLDVVEVTELYYHLEVVKTHTLSLSISGSLTRSPARTLALAFDLQRTRILRFPLYTRYKNVEND